MVARLQQVSALHSVELEPSWVTSLKRLGTCLISMCYALYKNGNYYYYYYLQPCFHQLKALWIQIILFLFLILSGYIFVLIDIIKPLLNTCFCMHTGLGIHLDLIVDLVLTETMDSTTTSLSPIKNTVGYILFVLFERFCLCFDIQPLMVYCVCTT